MVSPKCLKVLVCARWIRWLLVVALAMLYAGWSAYVISHNKPLDFNVYYITATAFRAGENPYTFGIWGERWTAWASKLGITNFHPPYRYPPLVAQLVAPLTLLSPSVAAAVWLAASALALVVAAWWIGRSSPYYWSIPLALVLMLGFVPPLTTLYTGQVNALVLAALAFSLYGFARQRSGVMGAGVATGTMLKLFPLPLLAYLGWRRQWQAAAVCVVLIVLLLLSSMVLIRWEGLQSYVRNILYLGEPTRLSPLPFNQAFTGFFARLLTRNDAGWSLMDNPALARVLARCASSVLVIATVLMCWPTGDLRRTFRLEYTLVIVATQLITPYAWYHQFTLLFIPFAILAEEALAERSLRWMLIPLAVGFVFTDVHGLAWRYFLGHTLLLSFPFYTALLLWGLLAWLILREKKQMKLAQYGEDRS